MYPTMTSKEWDDCAQFYSDGMVEWRCRKPDFQKAAKETRDRYLVEFVRIAKSQVEWFRDYLLDHLYDEYSSHIGIAVMASEDYQNTPEEYQEDFWMDQIDEAESNILYILNPNVHIDPRKVLHFKNQLEEVYCYSDRKEKIAPAVKILLIIIAIILNKSTDTKYADFDGDSDAL